MADAPAPSSPKVNGVEIVLIVVLVFGAIGVLTGNPLRPTTPNSTPAATTPSTAQCGIVLSSPKKLEKIQHVVRVAGTITSCDSFVPATSSTDTTLHIQVVDKNGTPASPYAPVTIGTSATFTLSVPITGTPVPGTGYVIVVGSPQDDGSSLSTRVPIIFQ